MCRPWLSAAAEWVQMQHREGFEIELLVLATTVFASHPCLLLWVAH